MLETQWSICSGYTVAAIGHQTLKCKCKRAQLFSHQWATAPKSAAHVTLRHLIHLLQYPHFLATPRKVIGKLFHHLELLCTWSQNAFARAPGSRTSEESDLNPQAVRMGTCEFRVACHPASNKRPTGSSDLWVL